MATVCPYIAIFMIDTFFYLSQHFADITASVNSLFQNLLGDITYVVCGFPKSATLFQLSRKGSTVTQSGRPTVYAYPVNFPTDRYRSDRLFTHTGTSWRISKPPTG